MACLTKRQEHQRDRASNIVIETGYVVRRCRKLPRDYVMPGYPLPFRSMIPCSKRPESAPNIPTLVVMNVNPPNVNSGKLVTVSNG